MSLTEHTKMNLYVFAALASLAFSGGFFYAVASNTTSRVEKIEARQDAIESSIYQMRSDVRLMRCKIVKDCE